MTFKLCIFIHILMLYWIILNFSIYFSNKFTNDPGKRLSESAVGITEYISDLPGFSGIIKARYV